MNGYNKDYSLLPWSEIWDYLPLSNYDKPNISNTPFISQAEHPLLGIPFYQLHPCETSKLMNEKEK
eukprot:gene2869-3565_t